eukprot:2875383-Pyramimonas_sp.AAC.1
MCPFRHFGIDRGRPEVCHSTFARPRGPIGRTVSRRVALHNLASTTRRYDAMSCPMDILLVSGACARSYQIRWITWR